ncbi:zf-HC2 domain-containing protein [Promicromonospora sp. MEB111]|uniref:zf-HC2 domain-containing protein n=1 Tax=unclassified Promicromonospora TaxID=2647929 RepID=UPI00254E5639|nr:zf-HC2 domain-containing protein [Promicromonospora sp. MEB111]
MSHLGDLVSALADGQLSPAETERALSHVTMCRLCARELDTARAARRALLSAADVVPDPALTARLMALQASIPSTDEDPLRRPFLGPDPLAAPVWQASAFGDFDGRIDRPARRRRTARITALGVGGAGVLGLALFTLGDVPVVSPQLSAQTSMTMLGRTGPDAAAAGQDVLAELDVDPAQVTPAALDWAADNGWVAPADLPDGYTVSAMRLVGDEGQTLEIDLTGPSGHAVVRERAGQLAQGGTTVGGVQVLATEPAHVAWQSDDMVVDVVADAPEEVLTELVASFGEHGYDAGVLPRIARGWHTVTGAIESP